MGDINRKSLDDLFRGLQASFRGAFASTMPFAYERLCTVVKSTTASEEYTWLGESQEMREWIGPRMLHELASHRYNIRNRKFESSIKVRGDDIKDDTLGGYSTLAASMGEAVKLQPARLVADILSGTDTMSGAALPAQYLKCYDGQNFFDTQHPTTNIVDGSVTLASNDRGGSARQPFYMLDLSRTLKPLILQNREDPEFSSLTDTSSDHVWKFDEFLYGCKRRNAVGFGLWQLAMRSRNGAPGDIVALGAEVEAMAFAMKQIKNDQGRFMGINPRVIVTGPSNVNDFKRLLQTPEFNVGTATAPNAKLINVNYGAFDLIEVPYLP